MEALLSSFSFSDELAGRQLLSPPQKQLLLGAPASRSEEPSVDRSLSLAVRASPGSVGGDEEAATARVAGFLSETELPSLLDLEDINVQALFLAELRRLCESSSPVFSNVAMIVLMTFATHMRFLVLEPCQLAALLHLLRDAALQGDDDRRTLVVELLTSLTRSPHLEKVGPVGVRASPRLRLGLVGHPNPHEPARRTSLTLTLALTLALALTLNPGRSTLQSPPPPSQAEGSRVGAADGSFDVVTGLLLQAHGTRQPVAPCVSKR